MKELITKTLEWAEERNMFDVVHGATTLTQNSKLLEEVVELRDELLFDPATLAAKLEIGDCVVVLIMIAELMGTSLEECLQLAYDKIKDRKGEMRKGKFVKESDL